MRSNQKVKTKEEEFDWAPIKKVSTFLIVSLVTATGTYFGLDKKPEEVKDDNKLEKITLSGNNNTNNNTVNNINNTNNTNNVNNTNNINNNQPRTIVVKTKEIIIQPTNEVNTDPFGSVSSDAISNMKLEINFYSTQDYQVNQRQNIILLISEDYQELGLFKSESHQVEVSGNFLIFRWNGKEYRSNPIVFIGNRTKISFREI